MTIYYDANDFYHSTNLENLDPLRAILGTYPTLDGVKKINHQYEFLKGARIGDGDTIEYWNRLQEPSDYYMTTPPGSNKQQKVSMAYIIPSHGSFEENRNKPFELFEPNYWGVMYKAKGPAIKNNFDGIDDHVRFFGSLMGNRKIYTNYTFNINITSFNNYFYKNENNLTYENFTRNVDSNLLINYNIYYYYQPFVKISNPDMQYISYDRVWYRMDLESSVPYPYYIGTLSPENWVNHKQTWNDPLLSNLSNPAKGWWPHFAPISGFSPARSEAYYREYIKTLISEYQTRLAAASISRDEMINKNRNIFILKNHNLDFGGGGYFNMESPYKKDFFPYYSELHISNTPESYNPKLLKLLTETRMLKFVLQGIKNNLSTTDMKFYSGGVPEFIKSHDLIEMLKEMNMATFSEASDELFLLDDIDRMPDNSNDIFVNQANLLSFLHQLDLQIREETRQLREVLDPQNPIYQSGFPDIGGYEFAHLYLNLLDISENTTFALAYKVEKYLENDTSTPIQTYYVVDSHHDFSFCDTQMKYGEVYLYKVYKLVCVFGSNYRYGDWSNFERRGENYTVAGPPTNEFKTPNDPNGWRHFFLDAATHGDLVSTASATWNPKYRVRPEEEGTPVQRGRLVDYRCWGPRDLDRLHPDESNTFTMMGISEVIHSYRPKVLEVPVGEYKKALYDFMPPKPHVHIGAGDKNEIVFFLSPTVPSGDEKHVPLDKEENKITELLELSRGQIDSDIDDLPFDGRYEIYKLDKKPTNITDFYNNKIVTINEFEQHLRRVPGIKGDTWQAVEPPVSLLNGHFVDKIQTNRKYYYLVRGLSPQDTPSAPSPIYEVELLETSAGSILQVNPYKIEYQTEKYDKHVSAKRLIKLIPNIEQVTFEEKDGEVSVGVLNKKLFTADGNRFKIRITSKHTGKKVDLNINFKIIKKTNYS